MKKQLKVVGGTSVAVLGVGVGSSAYAIDAATTTLITAGFASVQADFLTLLGLAYPVLIMITTGLVIFGLVKMFIHKAAGK